MTAHVEPGRLPRLAADAVLAFSIVLAGVEIGRIAVVGSHRDVVIAVVATAIFLPLHTWHLRYGLRGARPPRSGYTFAVVAAAQVAALALIGPAWSFMLAALATSALIVLRPRWSLALLALCAAAPALIHLIRPDLPIPLGVSLFYLGYSVVFRASIQFTLIWLVAATHQLARSREALAQEAAEIERARVEADMRASLERGMGVLADAGRHARSAAALPGDAPALVAIDRLLEMARDAHADLRRIVSDARRPRRRLAVSALAGRARDARTPVGRGLALRPAWLAFAAVQTIVLAFLLLSPLGVMHPGPGANAALVVPFWVAVAALELSLALDRARGRQPRHALARWLLILVLAVAGLPLMGEDWLYAPWLVTAGALLAFGRRGVVVAAIAGISHIALDVVWTIVDYSGMTLLFQVWNACYASALTALTVLGLYGSAQFVKLLRDLDDTRDALAEQAMQTERRRLSGDLHDVLGQTLTAISLKADLARRTLARDRESALAELDGVVALATGQAGELEAVARGERETSFDAEVASAIDLLRATGVAVDAEIAPQPLDAQTSTLLGFAVREGVTNILRHADARHCTIRLAYREDSVEFELRNDGAGGDRGHGSGLHSLADRVATHGGSAGAEQAAGQFALRVTLPLQRAYA
jgi:two-component system sensor histidine kinase DesK